MPYFKLKNCERKVIHKCYLVIDKDIRQVQHLVLAEINSDLLAEKVQIKVKILKQRTMESNLEEENLPTDLSSFKCKICGQAFKRKGNLATHAASVHEGQKPFKCENCQYSAS